LEMLEVRTMVPDFIKHIELETILDINKTETSQLIDEKFKGIRDEIFG